MIVGWLLMILEGRELSLATTTKNFQTPQKAKFPSETGSDNPNLSPVIKGEAEFCLLSIRKKGGHLTRFGQLTK